MKNLFPLMLMFILISCGHKKNEDARLSEIKQIIPGSKWKSYQYYPEDADSTSFKFRFSSDSFYIRDGLFRMEFPFKYSIVDTANIAFNTDKEELVLKIKRLKEDKFDFSLISPTTTMEYKTIREH